MCPVKVLLFSVSVLSAIPTNAKTYYFNINKTTNEYIVHNRVNLMSSAQNYPSRDSLGELRNVKATPSSSSTHGIPRPLCPVLDEEWLPGRKSNATKAADLPKYVHKLYSSVVKEVRNHVEPGPIRILFDTNAHARNSSIIRFNMTSLNATRDSNITNVDLFFYFNVTERMLKKPLVLRLYQIEDEHINGTSLINPDAHKLLNVIYVLEAESGWQVFKLKNAISNWVGENKHHGLFLTVSKPNEHQFEIYRNGNNATFRTFVVVRSHSTINKNFTTDTAISNQRQSCFKHDLHVDFRKDPYFDFIVAPASYNAFRCSGRCLRDDSSLTSHQKLLSYFYPTPAKPVYCVPISYAPLPVMFFDAAGNLAIKLYGDMIVEKCGCR